MSSLKDRFSILMTHEDLIPNQFYIKTGLANGFLDKVGSRVNKSTEEKIKKAFPNLNMNWLLYGKGDMLKCEKLNSAQSIVGDDNILNSGTINNNINTDVKNRYSDALLELYVPSNIKKNKAKDLTQDEFIEVMFNTQEVLKNKIIELEKEVIKLKGEVARRDETIKGLRNELDIRVEMIEFLQNKK